MLSAGEGEGGGKAQGEDGSCRALVSMLRNLDCILWAMEDTQGFEQRNDRLRFLFQIRLMAQ